MENPNGETGEAARDSARRAQSAAQEALHVAKDAAAQRIEREGHKVAESVQTTASSLRRAAEDVDGEHAWIGMALRKGADGLETASRTLSNGDLSQAAGALSDFARRQPAVFLGASVALGFVLARIGKTAVERAAPPQAAETPTYPTQGM